MPIYCYGCTDCGHYEEVLQRIKDEPITVCPSCEGNYTRLPTMPAAKVRECQKAEELGIKLPSEEAIAKKKEARENKLPWWRNGTVEGLPKKMKPIQLDKIADKQAYIEHGVTK
jgi:putative FmdB family regulatory protein